MLHPEYFNNKEERILELYRQLEDFILNDIAGRLLIAGEMSGTTDRLIYKLRSMGESRQEILKKLMQLTGLSNLELKSLLQDAILTSWEDDADTFKQLGIEISNPLENEAVIAVMDAEYKKSLGELSNLTRTTMKQSQIDLMNMMDEAEIRVASGVQSYSAAVCGILDKYAGRGIVIEYPTGVKRTLEAAVRMCVVTSMNQTAAQVTNQYIVEAKSEYVLVSAHLGARTLQKGQPMIADHSAWQGKVYRIRGIEPEYPNLLESTGYDIDPETGQGKVVNPLGLHGYNCRHGHQPWDKRLRNPYLDENGNLKIENEENRKQYELQQKQRTMERAIRKTKRELLMKQQEINGVAETDVKEILQSEYDKLAYKLREQNQKYNTFCEENNLQKQYDRIKVSGFTKAQSSKANGRATAYKNNTISSGNVTVNDITDKSIDNVPRIAAGGMDINAIAKLQDAHKSLLSVARRNNSWEVAVLYNAKFEKIDTVLGDAVSVNLNVPGRSKAMYVMHNHPNNASFSNRDISWLMKNPQVKYFSIVKNNGNAEIIHIPDNFDLIVFTIEYSRLLKKYKKEIENDKVSGYNKLIEKLLTKTKSGLEYVR